MFKLLSSEIIIEYILCVASSYKHDIVHANTINKLINFNINCMLVKKNWKTHIIIIFLSQASHRYILLYI